jgi:hypothetical protein
MAVNLERIIALFKNHHEFTAVVILSIENNKKQFTYMGNTYMQISYTNLYIDDIIIFKIQDSQYGLCYNHVKHLDYPKMIDIPLTRNNPPNYLYYVKDCEFDGHLYNSKEKMLELAFSHKLIDNEINYFLKDIENKQNYVYDYINLRDYDLDQICCITTSMHNFINQFAARPYIHPKTMSDATCTVPKQGNLTKTSNCVMFADKHFNNSNINEHYIAEADYKRILYENILFKKSPITNSEGCLYLDTTSGNVVCNTYKKVYRGSNDPTIMVNGTGKITNFLHTSVSKSVGSHFCNRKDLNDNITNPNHISGYLYEYTISPGIPYISFDSNPYGSQFITEKEILFIKDCQIKINKETIEEIDGKRVMFIQATLSYPYINSLINAHAELITPRTGLHWIDIESNEFINVNPPNVFNIVDNPNPNPNYKYIDRYANISKENITKDVLHYLYKIYQDKKLTDEDINQMFIRVLSFNGLDKSNTEISKQQLIKYLNALPNIQSDEFTQKWDRKWDRIKNGFNDKSRAKGLEYKYIIGKKTTKISENEIIKIYKHYFDKTLKNDEATRLMSYVKNTFSPPIDSASITIENFIVGLNNLIHNENLEETSDIRKLKRLVFAFNSDKLNQKTGPTADGNPLWVFKGGFKAGSFKKINKSKKYIKKITIKMNKSKMNKSKMNKSKMNKSKMNKSKKNYN